MQRAPPRQERNRRLRQDLRGDLYLKSRILPILFHHCACSFRGNFFVIGSHARVDVRTLRAVITIEDRYEFIIYAGEFDQGRAYHLRVASSSAQFSRFVYGLRRLTQRNESLSGADEINDTSITIGMRKRPETSSSLHLPDCELPGAVPAPYLCDASCAGSSLLSSLTGWLMSSSCCRAISSGCSRCSCGVPSRVRAVLAWLPEARRAKSTGAPHPLPRSTRSHTLTNSPDTLHTATLRGPALPPPRAGRAASSSSSSSSSAATARRPQTTPRHPNPHARADGTPAQPLAPLGSGGEGSMTARGSTSLPPRMRSTTSRARDRRAARRAADPATARVCAASQSRRPWRVAHGAPPPQDGAPPRRARPAAIGGDAGGGRGGGKAGGGGEGCAGGGAGGGGRGGHSDSDGRVRDDRVDAAAAASDGPSGGAGAAGGGSAAPAAAGSTAAAQLSALVPEAAEAKAEAKVRPRRARGQSRRRRRRCGGGGGGGAHTAHVVMERTGAQCARRPRLPRRRRRRRRRTTRQRWMQQ